MVNCAHGTESIRVGFHVSSAVIRVFAGLTSASVRMLPRAESQSGQGSREAPGPSVPGRVRFATRM